MRADDEVATPALRSPAPGRCSNPASSSGHAADEEAFASSPPSSGRRLFSANTAGSRSCARHSSHVPANTGFWAPMVRSSMPSPLTSPALLAEVPAASSVDAFENEARASVATVGRLETAEQKVCRNPPEGDDLSGGSPGES